MRVRRLLGRMFCVLRRRRLRRRQELRPRNNMGIIITIIHILIDIRGDIRLRLVHRGRLRRVIIHLLRCLPGKGHYHRLRHLP